MSRSPLPIVNPQGRDEEMIHGLQRESLDYFLKEIDPETGLTFDCTRPGSPVSVAATGLALTAYVVAAYRGLITREDARARIGKILAFFRESSQGSGADATGYRGFYYHFLAPGTGRRTWTCELSTIDTAILIAGMLSAAMYFDGADSTEVEIRETAESLYRRVEWDWALDSRATLSHGWKPESGFLDYRWDTGYSEAHILYLLALGSPTHAIDPRGYRDWIATFEVKTHYGIKTLHAGPLFIHQLSQIWIDFRGLRDEATRRTGFDYFENSRRATRIQRRYAIANPHGFRHYDENSWGITASDGPGPARLKRDGRLRTFLGYAARGVPDGPDDGTLSPWAMATSLPFAPEIVLNGIRHAIERLDLKNLDRPPGFEASFNPTFPDRSQNRHGWVCPWRFGLNQGPVVAMVENFRTEFVWDLMKKHAAIASGLRRAGFRPVKEDPRTDGIGTADPTLLF
jgi:hypothetical protein